MKFKQDEAIIRKKLCKAELFSLLVFYALCGGVLYPLLISVDNNIAFEGNALTSVLSYSVSLFEIIGVSAAYAVIIFGIYKLGAKGFSAGAWIFVIATVFKYLLYTVVRWVLAGRVPEKFGFELLDVLFFTVLEGIQLLVFWLTVKIVFENKKLSQKVYPFVKIYDNSNSVLRAALAGAIIVFASRFLGLFINDIGLIFIGGLPKKAITVLLMVLNYLPSLIFGVLNYLLVRTALSKLFKKYNE